MTREDIDNIIRIICPNDEDFEKPIISPAYLKKELETLALEEEPRKITYEDVKGYCKPRCLTIIDNALLYELTHPKIKTRYWKTGHWIKMFLTDTGDIDGQCSECGFIHKFIDGHTAQYNYCPNCGCRMVEPQESEE